MHTTHTQLINPQHLPVMTDAEQEFDVRRGIIAPMYDLSSVWEETHSEGCALDSEHEESLHKAPMVFTYGFSSSGMGTSSKRFGEDILLVEVSEKTGSDEVNDTTNENMETIRCRVFFEKTMHLQGRLLSVDSKLRGWLGSINGIATSNTSKARLKNCIYKTCTIKVKLNHLEETTGKPA